MGTRRRRRDRLRPDAGRRALRRPVPRGHARGGAGASTPSGTPRWRPRSACSSSGSGPRSSPRTRPSPPCKTVRGQVTEANAVGDLQALVGRLGLPRSGDRRPAAGPQGRARPAAGGDPDAEGGHRRRGREARGVVGLAQRRRPGCATCWRPGSRSPGSTGRPTTSCGSGSPARGRRTPRRRKAHFSEQQEKREALARGEGAAGQGGRGAGRRRPTGARPPASTAT